ncbi:MAG: hypothetical protein EB828_05640 [Nitrosopumilus sp. D6]|nr:MAG: hypothetical protein EB828_05640 [Nitrosopumilus sp. D6]
MIILLLITSYYVRQSIQFKGGFYSFNQFKYNRTSRKTLINMGDLDGNQCLVLDHLFLTEPPTPTL